MRAWGKRRRRYTAISGSLIRTKGSVSSLCLAIVAATWNAYARWRRCRQPVSLRSARSTLTASGCVGRAGGSMVNVRAQGKRASRLPRVITYGGLGCPCSRRQHCQIMVASAPLLVGVHVSKGWLIKTTLIRALPWTGLQAAAAGLRRTAAPRANQSRQTSGRPWSRAGGSDQGREAGAGCRKSTLPPIGR